MGIVPLQYKAGDTAESLGLTGKEKFDIHLPATLVPGQDIAVNTDSGKSFNVTSRYDMDQGTKETKTLSKKCTFFKTLMPERDISSIFSGLTRILSWYTMHMGASSTTW